MALVSVRNVSLVSNRKPDYTGIYVKSLKIGSWLNDSVESVLIPYNSFGLFLVVTG